jgi:hypothetical protein
MSWMLGVGCWVSDVKTWKIFSFGFWLFPFALFGQISTKIDTAHIKIGEPVHYTITVPLTAKKQILLPELKDTLTYHIEILEQKTDTVFENEKKLLRQHLILSCYDPGEFLIRSLPVVVGSDTLLTKSFQIRVDDVEIDSANLAGFPIKPIMEEEYTLADYWDKYWVYLLVGALVFLILLVVAVLFLRSKKGNSGKSKKVLTPYEEAINGLKSIDKKKYVEKGLVYPFYSELSYIIRNYLGKVYHFSSLELLSDDLVDYFRRTTHLEKDETEKLRQFLFDSDLVKFAKAVPEEEKHKYYRIWAEELIEKTKPLELEDETVPELKPNEQYRKIT